jgi:hypothetical protein
MSALSTHFRGKCPTFQMYEVANAQNSKIRKQAFVLESQKHLMT